MDKRAQLLAMLGMAAMLGMLAGCGQNAQNPRDYSQVCATGTLWNGSQCVLDAADIADADATDAVTTDAADTDAKSAADTVDASDGTDATDSAASADSADGAGETGEDAGTDAGVDVPADGTTVCAADCTGKNCGSDGCGGSCGDCALTATTPVCSAAGVCVATQCVPNCADSSCGPDGCGGFCGTCGPGSACTLGYCATLVPELSCVGNCGKIAAGGCSCKAGCSGDSCCGDLASTCGCQPGCTGVLCGPDGCGGSCGVCEGGADCKDGACVVNPCVPDPCSGHGSCNGGMCSCDLGFDATACDACMPGYIGYPDCTSDPCLNQDCSGHGVCDPGSGACTCDSGFTGSICATCAFASQSWPNCSADPCTSQTCSGNGICVPTSGFCLCSPAFVGKQCGACLDPAASFPVCGEVTPTYDPDPILDAIDCPFCATRLENFPVTPDNTDTIPPQVLAAIPPNGATVGPNTPLALVLSEAIVPESITQNTFKLLVTGTNFPVAGNVRMEALPSGETLLIFLPTNLNVSGSFTLSLSGAYDKGGNLLTPWSSTFQIDSNLAGMDFGTNTSFENGTLGCSILGAANALPVSEDLTPTDGNLQLVLSSEDSAMLGSTSALANQVSIVTCGPFALPPDSGVLQFDYAFATSESGSGIYDDVALVFVSGPGGSTGGAISSASASNLTGFTSAYGLPDGSTVARTTGSQTATLSGIGTLGKFITLTFVVSDVGDTLKTSLLTVDHVRWF